MQTTTTSTAVARPLAGSRTTRVVATIFAAAAAAGGVAAFSSSDGHSGTSSAPVSPTISAVGPSQGTVDSALLHQHGIRALKPQPTAVERFHHFR